MNVQWTTFADYSICPSSAVFFFRRLMYADMQISRLANCITPTLPIFYSSFIFQTSSTEALRGGVKNSGNNFFSLSHPNEWALSVTVDSKQLMIEDHRQLLSILP